ncbi:MAG: rhomboid family intramembrane serine protease [Verrucomicrobiota bacterium]
MISDRNTATRRIVQLNVLVAVLVNLYFLITDSPAPWDWLGFSLPTFLSGAFWQPFTYMWMHAPLVGLGVIHILFNMLTLHFVGRVIENHLGAKRLLIIYFFGGFTSILLFSAEKMGINALVGLPLSTQAVPLVGASGSLCALIAVFALLFPNTKVFLMFIPIPIKARTMLYGFCLFSLLAILFGWMNFVSHSAHLGGILFGWLYFLKFQSRPGQPRIDTSFRQVSPEQMISWEINTLSTQELGSEFRVIQKKLRENPEVELSLREKLILKRVQELL